MMKKTVLVLCSVALAAAAYGVDGSRVGLYFRLPGTNDTETIDADELCWGASPSKPKKITAASVLTIPDGYAERYYMYYSAEEDPCVGDRPYYMQDHYCLPTNIASWKGVTLVSAFGDSNLWATAEARDFSSKRRLSPSLAEKINYVRTTFRDGVPNHGKLLDDAAPSSSWSGFGLTFDSKGWTTNEEYQTRLCDAVMNNECGWNYGLCQEAISNQTHVRLFPVNLDENLGDVQMEWLATNLGSRVQSLRDMLQSRLPPGEGNLPSGWLSGTNRLLRVTAGDFAWMNAILASMDTLEPSRTYMWPFPQYAMAGYERNVVSADVAVSASAGNFRFVSNSIGRSTFMFDLTDINMQIRPATNAASVVTNDLGITSVPEWGFAGGAAAGAYISIDDAATNGVVAITRNELLNALSGFTLDANWTPLEWVVQRGNFGVRVYARPQGSALGVVLIVEASLSDLAEAGKKLKYSDMEYTCNFSTRCPVGNLSCRPFVDPGRDWVALNASAPALWPPKVAFDNGFVGSLAIQCCAQRTVYAEDEDEGEDIVDEFMAIGRRSLPPQLSELHNGVHDILKGILPNCSARVLEASGLTGISITSLSDMESIESAVRARLLSSIGQHEMPVNFFLQYEDPFPGRLSVRVVNGVMETTGEELLNNGRILIGRLYGGVGINGQTNLKVAHIDLWANFCPMATFNFWNL